jgi:uncharacterized protein YjiS (DUF1127 family)
MTTFTTNRTTFVTATVAGRIATFAHNAIGAAVSWNDARMTRNALSALSARELEDIGLSYADIETIAGRR